MIKIKQNFFILYLICCLSLNSVLAILPTPEDFTKDVNNPIPELYEKVSPEYMREVLGNVTTIFDSYVFSDILKSPPYPYNDTKVNISEEFSKIDISVERPFYEFYRDFRKALSASRDANIEIIGDILPLNETIKFLEYRYCLPFQFYVDYSDNGKVNLFIKEYPTCSQFYDNTTRNFIIEHKNIPVETINGIDSFEYIQNYGNETYKFKNPDSQFSIFIEHIHDNNFIYVPLSIEELNSVNLSFGPSDTLNTYFHIIKDSNKTNEKDEHKYSTENSNNIDWKYISENGEIKCLVDYENEF